MPLPTRRPRLAAGLLSAAMALAGLVAVAAPAAAATTITVDLSASTGAIKHGASGFLYGLGDEQIPTDTMLNGLSHLGVAAQKAPDGAQHPNGDALKIAPQWKRNGGGDIQIYMQDIYTNWPYEDLGIEDYLQKVDVMARKVVADPHRTSYVYVPFNEPDQIWYGSDIDRLNRDWKRVYDRIRAIDPQARIAGPNYASYNSAHYRSFMSAAKANNALPDVVTWHELGDNFFSGYYDRYADFRRIESDLGISPRPISINEYGRFSGDLAVPGNLVQWMTRLENTKVDGSLAFWTSAGTLNDLVTRNNQATGGWWLYHWYGLMSGNTVQVTLPDRNQPTQVLATYDRSKSQARVLLGGNLDPAGSFDADLRLTGLGSTPFGSRAHVTVWGVDSSGLDPSAGPYKVAETDLAAANGALTLPLRGLKGSSAYYAIITPDTDTGPLPNGRYEAEYARISGTARIVHGGNTGYSGTSFVQGYGATSDATTSYFVTSPDNGFYDLSVRYSAGPLGNAPTTRQLRLRLNQRDTATLSLPSTADWNTWRTVTRRVYLPAGISQLDLSAFTTDESDAVNIDYVDLTAVQGTAQTIEAEASANTLSGTAARSSNSAASGGSYVGYIGNGAGNTLRLNAITAPSAGDYTVVLHYANNEVAGGQHAYNSKAINRFGRLSVNGSSETTLVPFRSTGGWSTWRTVAVRVRLAAGANTLTLSQTQGYVADIDKVIVAPTIT